MAQKTRKGAAPEAAAPPRAVTVGSAAIDVIAAIAPAEIERAELTNIGLTYLMLEEGRKYPAESITSHVGGGGVNVAVGLARQGWRASALAATGADQNAEIVARHLRENGADPGALRSKPDAETGVSVMVASHHRNAAVLVHRGANERLAKEDFDDALFEGARLVYIAPLSSGSADCFPALIEQGCWAGAMVAANPGARQLASRSEALLGALGNVHLLSLNAHELSVLAPTLIARGAVAASVRELAAAAPKKPATEAKGAGPRLLEAELGAGAQTAPFRALLAALHRLGPRWISITDGAAGAYLSIDPSANRPSCAPDAPAAEAAEAEAARLLYRGPAKVGRIAGTAGAGDAYGGTLAAQLALGAAPETAMTRAAVNAASVVERLNTSDGLLDLAALEKRAAKEKDAARRL